MSKTADLQQRIAKLETDAAEQWALVDKLESEVTEAYAQGGDVDKKRKELSAAQNEARSMTELLGKLDTKLVEVSQKENRDARESLKKQAHSEYARTVKIVTQGLNGLSADLAKTLSKARAKQVQQTVSDAVKDALWYETNEAFSDQYVESVPKAIRSIPLRDSRGQRADGVPGVQHIEQSAQGNRAAAKQNTKHRVPSAV